MVVWRDTVLQCGKKWAWPSKHFWHVLRAVYCLLGPKILVTPLSQGVFLTEAMAEFQQVKCMTVRIREVMRVACYARAETFSEAVASVASIAATPLHYTGTDNRN